MSQLSFLYFWVLLRKIGRDDVAVELGAGMKEGNLAKTKSMCRNCCNTTWHEVLFRKQFILNCDDPEDGYEYWELLECLGCDSLSFRCETIGVFSDYGRNFETTVVNSQVYPKVLGRHAKIHETYWLPKVIETIYLQTVGALADSSFILGGIGLRCCVEAVCNDRSIARGDLKKRIDLLFKEGLVSKGDKQRLHAIRFMGNDAAHEITQPSPDDLASALTIVEHLLMSVYVLPKRAQNLDVEVETYEGFLEILELSASEHQGPTEMDLKTLCGKRFRRIYSQVEQYEEKLLKDIASGAIKYLKVVEVEGGDVLPPKRYIVVVEYFNVFG
ncbi:DUF4145 domain-containing protein [Chitiniphilus eburneus]|uniref:DUF4145 domain-containing protein n=1 Tax=Chitiniphilus eburneus TaxID=2571148 RepID=UPI0035D03A38